MMDLGLTDLQELLRSTARSFVQRDYPMSHHRERVEAGLVFDPETWQRMVQLQWPGLRIAEQYGGAGGTWVDLTILLEELGRGLVPTTLLTHVLAAEVLSRWGTDEQRGRLLLLLAAGRPIAALALTEPWGTLDRAGIATVAAPVDGGFTLTGVKHFVRGAGAADLFVVVARLDEGVGLFIADRDSAGVEITPLRPISGDDQGIVRFDRVTLGQDALIGGAALPWSILNEIVAWGALIESGYAIGIMARDSEMTIQYVKNRVQFGRPLGAFQAVQHQVADQVTDLDCSRYLTLYAAWSLDEGRADALTTIARAKAWVSGALRRVTRTGNQLHGGIGFASEYDLHFYYERAKTSEFMFGSADEQREHVAAALLD